MKQEEVDQLRAAATRKVRAAVQKGDLPKITKKTKCTDCGGTATEYEHRDYFKPLEVVPICRRCNMRRGPAHPISDDRYERCGQKWSGLNEGEGVEWTFTGRCIAELNWKDIDWELEMAKRTPDPDIAIADFELRRLNNVKSYQKQKKFRIKDIVIGQRRYTVRFTKNSRLVDKVFHTMPPIKPSYSVEQAA